jgi:superfamily II DNA helicase RecQ
MVEEGLLRQEDVGNGYPRPVIKLAERGRELIMMHPTPPPKATPRASDDFEECFKRLRVWRSGIAKQRGIAAFCIFHDSTLKTLAEQQPSTMDDLRGIPGMGPKKLADYGDAVLRAIAER